MNWNNSKNCCCNAQTLSLSGTDLFIQDGNTVSLSALLDNTDEQTLSLSGTNLSIENGNTVDLSPIIPLSSVSLTEVLRTRLDITPDGNINSTDLANPMGLSIGSIDEIGITLTGAPEPGGNAFVLPAGNYEIEFHPNFTMSSGEPRVNFNFLLRDGATVIDTAYGGVYMRNINAHDQAGNTVLFELQTNGGSYNVATIREASDGDTSLDGGVFIIRRYEQKIINSFVI